MTGRSRIAAIGMGLAAVGLCVGGAALTGSAFAAAGSTPGAASTAVVAAATSTVPSGGATTVVPAVPHVASSITDGQNADALLARAIALSSAGASQAPLQASLSRAQQALVAQNVAADRASAAAVAATAAAGTAQRRARAATSSAASLEGALRQAALRLYTGGTEGAIPSNPGTSIDEIAFAAAYEETLLSPDGILDQRRADAAVARRAAASRRKQLSAALHDQALADSARAGATRTLDQIKGELSALGSATATLVSAERTEISSQAGRSLTGPAALDFTPATPPPAPLPTTSVALAWAFSELGKPYLWGGTGPAAFDCSGLTQYVWAKAGVAIPRVAAAQDAWTVPVPLSQLLPGDLVFYGTTDIHHVGMYIGDGLMIDAPHTGASVSITSIWWSDLAGFGRVHAAGVPVPARTLPSPANPAPPLVQPSVGAVPSESKPPPGYVAPPGATAPVVVAPASPTAPSDSTTIPADSTTIPGGSTSTTLGSTSTTSGSTSTTAPTTTGPGATTTVPATTTTTTGSLLGLGG